MHNFDEVDIDSEYQGDGDKKYYRVRKSKQE